jgi:hypothetical protein
LKFRDGFETIFAAAEKFVDTEAALELHVTYRKRTSLIPPLEREIVLSCARLGGFEQ